MFVLSLIVAAIFGLAIGSFANVVILRTASGESPLRGRSRCPRCRRELAWFELIPVASWLVLGGRCRTCRSRISPQYPLVEAAAAILTALAVARFGVTLAGVLAAALFATLLVIFVYDLRHKLILDRMSIPAIIIGGLLSLVLHRSYASILVGAILGAGFFLAQYLLSHGRWIGGGDIRLGAALGIAAGWPLVVVTVVLAYLSGAVVALVLLIRRRSTWTSELPFGTFLSVAGVATILAGQELLQWYLHGDFFTWFYGLFFAQ